MIALIAAAAALIFLALTLLRLQAGPTLQDRALAAGSVITKAALVCGALAVALGQTEFVDVAFALVLGGFVLAAAILKVFRSGSFQAPMVRAGRDS